MKTFFTLFLGIFFGFIFSSATIVYSKDRYEKLKIYSQVFNLVEDHYVDKLDVDKLIIGSIRGLLGSLDPYSGYLSRKSYKRFKDETSGEFSGLGIELKLVRGILVIYGVVEDSPAWIAGIEAQDKIISINGDLIKGLDFTDATKHLKGRIGKKVSLTIKRDGEEKLLTFKLKRQKLKIRSVRKIANENKTLIIRISGFLDSTEKELMTALSGENFNNLLLDLRHNPGGLLQQAISVVDMFVEKGLIVKTVSRNTSPEEVLAQKQNTLFPEKKLYILVDNSSASASEIVASALKDLGRAQILGQKTYGKGSVQSVIPLPNKRGGVKMTIARYFTASDKMIDKKGVKPNKIFPKYIKTTRPVKNYKEDMALMWAFEEIDK